MGLIKKATKNIMRAAIKSVFDSTKADAEDDDDGDLPMWCNDCGASVVRINAELYRCPECGCEWTYEDDEWWFHSQMDDEWADINAISRPAACTGCGSDMWPDCQYSCKLFDN